VKHELILSNRICE